MKTATIAGGPRVQPYFDSHSLTLMQGVQELWICCTSCWTKPQSSPWWFSMAMNYQREFDPQRSIKDLEQYL
jgi:hypothetical protein